MSITAPSVWVGEQVTLELTDKALLPNVRVTAASDEGEWIEVEHDLQLRRISCREIRALIVLVPLSHPP